MKKIAFIVSTLTMGGVQKITVQLANELAKNSENRVEIIVLNGTQSYYETKCKVTFLNVHYNFANKVIRKVSNEFLHNLYLSNHLYFNALKKHFKKRNYDTVIASDGHMTMLLNELQLTAVKKIGWMHNNYQTYLNDYYVKYKDKFQDSLTQMDNVVVLTHADQENYKIHNQNTKCIFNPISLSKVNVSLLKNKEILFVARLTRNHKGLEYLLDIAEKIKPTGWIIRILGDGPDFEWLKSEIIQKNLADIVILEGAVKEGIEEYYAKASIFISTSRWEGMPLVMIEAIASGLPIISFAHTGAIEILDNGRYGIIVPNFDTDIFSKELSRLIENKDELERYQKLSLQRSEDFKIDKIIKEWEAIMNEK